MNFETDVNGLEILYTQSHCDGCNAKFSATYYVLSCSKVGGLIHSRHEESRDSLG